jgi:hypothetical protein
MVDWDRVDQLRKAGWAWDEIADDPKVGFQAAKGSGDPGRALQVLYRRRQGRGERKEASAPKPTKRQVEELDRKWTLTRISYLLTPLVAVWALIAYLSPSPVGLVLAAIPYVALLLAIAVAVLIYSLLRTARRWTKVFRSTVVGGIVLGLVFTGVVALVGVLVFGCPFLPPAAALASQPGPGWTHASVSPWQEGGRPVLFFYGATWCPYCSASSWAVYKALVEFGSLSSVSTGYSSLGDVYPGTPEMVLGNAQLVSNNVSFVVSEDLSGVDGTFPGTTGCYQSAYVAAYSGNSIPFVAVNGQYIHGGTSLIDPQPLSTYNYANAGSSGGAGAVQNQVQAESGAAWSVISSQAYWVMAYLVKATGAPPGYFAGQYHWTPATLTAVKNDLGQI